MRQVVDVKVALQNSLTILQTLRDHRNNFLSTVSDIVTIVLVGQCLTKESVVGGDRFKRLHGCTSEKIEQFMGENQDLDSCFDRTSETETDHGSQCSRKNFILQRLYNSLRHTIRGYILRYSILIDPGRRDLMLVVTRPSGG